MYTLGASKFTCVSALRGAARSAAIRGVDIDAALPYVVFHIVACSIGGYL